MKIRIKRKKMKRSKLLLLLPLFFLVCCSVTNYWKVRVDIPAKIVLDLNQYSSIVVTDFLVQKEPKEFNLNQEIVKYFAVGLEQQFKGKVSSKKVSLEKEELFQDRDFWKSLFPDQEGTVILTGNASYTQEIRKAILETRKKRDEDFYSRSQAIEERRFYTLDLSLYLIDTTTGEALYTRTFKETQGYNNPNQTVPFAFFDLVEKVKGKLFQNLLGGVRIQERYLIVD